MPSDYGAAIDDGKNLIFSSLKRNAAPGNRCDRARMRNPFPRGKGFFRFKEPPRGKRLNRAGRQIRSRVAKQFSFPNTAARETLESGGMKSPFPRGKTIFISKNRHAGNA
ncbi:MAG: hypothetical protein GX444_20610 [Myxococcales bacterium]|nr:hypothetical protein [Myxococcales bacterium]